MSARGARKSKPRLLWVIERISEERKWEPIHHLETDSVFTSRSSATTRIYNLRSSFQYSDLRAWPYVPRSRRGER